MNVFDRINQNKIFLSRILINVIIQLCITYYVMNRNSNPDVNTIFLFVVTIAIAIILSIMPLPEYIKLLLFTLFSYLFGLVFYQLKTKYNYNKDVINTAIMGAISVFISMIFVGIILLSFGIRLGFKFGIFLLFSLLALFISRLVFAFKSAETSTMSSTHKILTTVGIFLFAAYVVYDTNTILQRNYNKDQYISASLNYYLDFINLFSNTLQDA